MLLIHISVLSQDTNKTRTDTAKIPFKFLVSETKYSYLNQVNPDTIGRKRILWLPLKAIDNIFDYLPGYYARTMDVGQVNQITFNQLDNSNTAVLRNGRPVNDMIDGSIDLNLFSRNEIDEIETTDGFGNSNYNYLNNVNIISRQKFQHGPYTEIAFRQDRYANEYVDAYFSQDFFKGFNFNFGITKHSYDGKYANSDFDKWLGRFNFNLAPSKNLNFFLYTNYARIQRGMNEGINPDTVDLGNKETMFNPALAVVKNSDAYEIKERFDIDGGALFHKGISFTKLQFYVSNSFRKYRDEENRPIPNGILIKDNIHWINYGVKLQEILNFKLSKKINLVSRTEAEYNNLIQMYNSDFSYLAYIPHYTFNYFNIIEDIGVISNNLSLDVYLKSRSRFTANQINIISNGGAELKYRIELDSLNKIDLSGMYNSMNDYIDGGISYRHGKNSVSAKFYIYNINTYNSNGTFFDKYYINGINASCDLSIFNIDLDLVYNYNFNKESYLNRIFPLHNGNISLAYHNTGFKNKFEYKIGLASRFWSAYYSNTYFGLINAFLDYRSLNSLKSQVHVPSNATLDFYIIGKINRATFGLTFENILDRLIYNMGVYPAIDRGGLFNVWSGFYITWNFFE